jgi:GNAT superfamily N-acetyltransferase
MGGEPVTIRLATEADVPELAALVDRSVRALAVGFYSPEEIERSLVRVFGVDTQIVADRTYYVAEAARRPVGCGGWSRRRTLFGGDQMKGGEDPLLDPAVDAARVRAFFVDPAWARRGIGSGILRRSEATARAEGFHCAELVATLPGEPLYAAFGYERREEVRVDLGDGVVLRCWRMTKALG